MRFCALVWGYFNFFTQNITSQILTLKRNEIADDKTKQKLHRKLHNNEHIERMNHRKKTNNEKKHWQKPRFGSFFSYSIATLSVFFVCCVSFTSSKILRVGLLVFGKPAIADGLMCVCVWVRCCVVTTATAAAPPFLTHERIITCTTSRMAHTFTWRIWRTHTLACDNAEIAMATTPTAAPATASPMACVYARIQLYVYRNDDRITFHQHSYRVCVCVHKHTHTYAYAIRSGE